jgi:hypothetical protein
MFNNIKFVYKNYMYLQSRVKLRTCKKWKEHSERMNSVFQDKFLHINCKGKRCQGRPRNLEQVLSANSRLYMLIMCPNTGQHISVGEGQACVQMCWTMLKTVEAEDEIFRAWTSFSSVLGGHFCCPPLPRGQLQYSPSLWLPSDAKMTTQWMGVSEEKRLSDMIDMSHNILVIVSVLEACRSRPCTPKGILRAPVLCLDE